MDIQIKRSSKRRTIAIKINEKGEVNVLCPQKCSIQNIESFVKEKQNWILTNIAKIKDKHISNQDYYNYNKVLFLGKELDIKYYKTKIYIGEQCLSCRENTKIETIIKKWLIEKAKQILPLYIEELSKLTKLSYKSITISYARKKWGSCDNLKNIKLNYRLIMLDEESIKYVCIHELAHTKQMNHSKEFWQIVENFYPNYRNIKHFMKAKNFVLELF